MHPVLPTLMPLAFFQGWAMWNSLSSCNLYLPHCIFPVVPGTVVLKLKCASESTGHLDTTQIPKPHDQNFWFWSLGLELRMWISIKFPGEATAAGPGPNFEEHCTGKSVLKQTDGFVLCLKALHVYSRNPNHWAGSTDTSAFPGTSPSCPHLWLRYTKHFPVLPPCHVPSHLQSLQIQVSPWRDSALSILGQLPLISQDSA